MVLESLSLEILKNPSGCGPEQPAVVDSVFDQELDLGDGLRSLPA